MNLDRPLALLNRTVPILAIVLCSGCASLNGSNQAAADRLPALTPGHNQILAWVPRDQAQTASVAHAAAYIALVQAKKATDTELCGGTWMFSGKLEQDDRTVLAQAPASLGSYTGWLVRVSWKPHLAECGVTETQYSLTLSRHLPQWMMAQTGQPLALFHQGSALYHQDDATRYALALGGAD